MAEATNSNSNSNSSPFSIPTGFEATQKRGKRKSVTLSNTLSTERSAESVYTQITDHSKPRSNSIVETIESAKTSLRIRVINQASNLFKDVLVEIRNDLTLFEAIYDKPAVKKANIRKWGSTVTKLVKSGSHEIRCSIWDDEVNSPCHTYSIDDMKQRSTRDLYYSVGPESDLIKLKLHCVDKKSADTLPILTRNFDHNPSAPDLRSSDRSAGKRNRSDRESGHKRLSNNSGPATATDTVSDIDENDNSTIRTSKSLGLSVLEANSTMRVRISNESSERYKDLIVNVGSDLNIHDSIYDHKCVKSAQVRKWTSDVERGVNQKVKEVQCVVLDGTAEGNVYAAYSIEALKKMSTKDLFDLVPKSDPVQLVLRCVDKKVKPTLTSPGSMSGTGSSKRSSRPNHMNLSALALNGSFSSFEDSSGSKNVSSAETNASKNVSIAETNASFVSDDKITKPSCLRSRSNSLNPRRFSDPLSTTDIKFSLKQIRTEYEDLKSDSAKQPISTLLENEAHPSSNGEPYGGVVVSKKQLSPTSASIVLDKERLSEFKRLCRSKKGKEFQSGEHLNKLPSFQSLSDRKNATLKSQAVDARNASMQISAFEIRDVSSNTSLSDSRDHTFKTASPSDPRNASLRTVGSDTTISLGNQSSVSKSASKRKLTGPDKINRFLEFSAKRKMPVEGDNAVAMTTLKRGESLKSVGSLNASVPPIAEIAVVTGHSSDASVKVEQPSIPLSGDLVKQVFPYHIVIDENFYIIQVGNSLHLLMDSAFIIGKCISDLFTITGPIPSFGEKWEWKNLDKMKEKTVFLEGLHTNSFLQKPKIKGSIIELSKSPERKVLLALSPNVKNLSELEGMNLSMQDLPVHSCQRDAVLLGEHSKSEVKLTNHLDQLHRDLIDSMEKQIENRTNELATANTNLESANSQLAVQSAKQLEHFACMSHEIRTPLNCIVGMSSLLLEDSDGPSMNPMHADSIRMINTSGELLRAVVDDVLDYAKLESGSFEVDIKPTKLQDTLDSVLYSISQKVQDKNIRVRTHFSPTVPEYIETDSRRLQQVLFNLLGNAGKFSKADSVIDLSVSLVKISSHSNRDLIRFSIRDYGKGIEKKDFETIFVPFSQAR